MNIVPIVKLVVSGISSASAGVVVGNAVKATTPDTLKRTSKVLVGIGSVVLAAVAGDAAGRYLEDQVDATIEGIKQATNRSPREAFEDAADTVKEKAADAAETVEEKARDTKENLRDE